MFWNGLHFNETAAHVAIENAVSYGSVCGGFYLKKKPLVLRVQSTKINQNSKTPSHVMMHVLRTELYNMENFRKHSLATKNRRISQHAMYHKRNST